MEAVLWALYAGGAMAALMTFEGANFDILIGLTAPLAALALTRGHRRLVLAWNAAGMLLLLTVLTLGVLSSPTPFQLLFTDPPNLALLTFPYIWIPAFLLPLGAAMHVLSIRQLLSGAKHTNSLTPVTAPVVPTGPIGDTK